MEEKKRKPDERIEKESNRLMGKFFYLVCVLLVVSLAVKCWFDLPYYVYALEIVSLMAGVVCFLFQELRNGILFVKKKDDALSELHNAALTKAMMTQFWIMVVGECIPVYLCAYVEELQQYFWWFASYMLVIAPVTVIITVVSIKKGLIVWGGKKQEKTGKKKFAITTVFAALLYGVLMEAFFGFRHVYHDGAFHAEGLLWIVGSGAFWGILFYFAMLGVIKISEKQANKRVQEADGEGGEAEGVVHEE
ncbi:MAG: hypothetical protein J6J38_08180 [Lachnospiraceae bacterium]|nr:hypothetical protein [Lachnospiraceae bacterium]